MITTTHRRRRGRAHEPFPSCQAIIDACHPADIGEGPAHDCHEVAHDDGAEEKCAAKRRSASRRARP